MTYEERESIFSKDAISTKELSQILGVSKSAASNLLQEIKRKQGDRLDMQGFIHIEDYFAYFGISDKTRYSRRFDEDSADYLPKTPRRSVCFGGA